MKELLDLGWRTPPTKQASAFQTASAIEKHCHDSKTVVTPKVHAIAKDLFLDKHLRRIAITPGLDYKPPVFPGPFPSHGAMMNCEWVGECDESPCHYQSVLINGEQYNVSTYPIILVK